MHGLVSLLPPPYYQRVEAVWDALESAFGMRGIRVTPYPHFSWQIAQKYPLDSLRKALQSLVAETEPFTVRTTGLSTFPGSNPVLFIAVDRSTELEKFHQKVWERLLQVGKGRSEYYAPDVWIPHISVGYGDTTPEKVREGTAFLLQQDSFEWEFQVDNLAYIYEPEGTVGKLRFKVQFQ